MKTIFFASTLVSIHLVSLVSARTNGQFEHFYSYYDYRMKQLFETDCSKEYNEMRANSSVGGYWVVKCALEHLNEMKKAEMAACSVLLGLLPIALQLIGPKLSEICILSLRRPLLAFLITLGSPCATLEHDRTGLEVTRKAQHEPLWPKFLMKPRSWMKALMSLAEYLLVGLAVANVLVQAYQLTFWAVVLVSTSTGTFGDTLEAFSPLLWIFLTIPVHLLGRCSLLLSQKLAREGARIGGTSIPAPLSVSRRIKKVVLHEFTPCAYQDCVVVLNEARPSYRLLLLNWMIKLGAWTQVIMGIIVLSSILFVSLWQTLEIVGRFLAGSIVCRIVLAFEIYSYREKSEGRLKAI